MAFDIASATESVADLGKEVASQVGEAVNHAEHNKSVLADNEGERAVVLSRHQLMLAQIKTNLAEIGTTSLFKSGWRPSIGWVCSAGLALYYLPQYAIASATWAAMCWAVIHAAIASGDVSAIQLPSYPATVDGLMELVVALLGMGTLRTIEKHTGKAKDAKPLSKRERAAIIQSSAPESWAQNFGGKGQ